MAFPVGLSRENVNPGKEDNMSFDIGKAEREIAELTAKVEAERKRLSRMSPVRAKAERLHDLTCTSNHDDMCGWFYEEWPAEGVAFRQYSTKKGYVEKVLKVEAFLKDKGTGMDFEDVLGLYKILRGY